MSGPDFIIPEGTYLAFNIIHGTFGEDGQIQAILDRQGIPYTGEGEVGSRLAFDKIASKIRFEEAGVPTARWEIVEKGSAPSLPLPFVVKPPREGSSVGVHIVQDTIALGTALEDCFARDHEVLIEELIQGAELTVGIVGDEAFPVVEIVPKVDFYTYENKYTKGASEYFCPARLDEETTRKVQQAALAAHRSLGLGSTPAWTCCSALRPAAPMCSRSIPSPAAAGTACCRRRGRRRNRLSRTLRADRGGVAWKGAS